MTRISVIVTTYNRPDALAACMDSLGDQTDRDFEVLLADDGSDERTAKILARRGSDTEYGIAVKHVYHEDRGFRAATIRNKAVAASQGEYLVFIDGDCIVFPDFVAMHRKLARPGYFVPGNRVLISRAFTDEVLKEQTPLHRRSWSYFLGLFLTRKINHIGSLVRLPLGPLRLLQKRKWKNAKTCNLGLWKSDFEKVNGFDEIFEGWGYEDSDLVIRLIHAGILRKSGRHRVPVLHLWHAENDRSREELNWQRLLERLKNPGLILAEKGINQYTEALRTPEPSH